MNTQQIIYTHKAIKLLKIRVKDDHVITGTTHIKILGSIVGNAPNIGGQGNDFFDYHLFRIHDGDLIGIRLTVGNHQLTGFGIIGQAVAVLNAERLADCYDLPGGHIHLVHDAMFFRLAINEAIGVRQQKVAVGAVRASTLMNGISVHSLDAEGHIILQHALDLGIGNIVVAAGHAENRAHGVIIGILGLGLHGSGFRGFAGNGGLLLRANDGHRAGIIITAAAQQRSHQQEKKDSTDRFHHFTSSSFHTLA